LAQHRQTLAELQNLVKQIASDVGFDGDGPFHRDVEILEERLKNVEFTLSTLASTVDTRVRNEELARNDLCQTKDMLDSVQQVHIYSILLLPMSKSSFVSFCYSEH